MDALFGEHSNRECSFFPKRFTAAFSLRKKRLAAICSGHVPGACPPCVRLVCPPFVHPVSALSAPQNLVRHVFRLVAVWPRLQTLSAMYPPWPPSDMCSPCIRLVPALYPPCVRLLPALSAPPNRVSAMLPSGSAMSPLLVSSLCPLVVRSLSALCLGLWFDFSSVSARWSLHLSLFCGAFVRLSRGLCIGLGCAFARCLYGHL